MKRKFEGANNKEKKRRKKDYTASEHRFSVAKWNKFITAMDLDLFASFKKSFTLKYLPEMNDSLSGEVCKATLDDFTMLVSVPINGDRVFGKKDWGKVRLYCKSTRTETKSFKKGNLKATIAGHGVAVNPIEKGMSAFLQKGREEKKKKVRTD